MNMGLSKILGNFDKFYFILVKEVYIFFSHSLGIVYIGGNILKCKIFYIYHVCSKRTWKGNPVAKKYICGTSVEKQYRIFFVMI